MLKAHIRPVPEEVETDIEDDENEEGDEEEFATQVRGSYFYKQSQVAVKYLHSLMGAKGFDNPKDHFELAKLFDYVTANDTSAIVLDFFAGIQEGRIGAILRRLQQLRDTVP